MPVAKPSVVGHDDENVGFAGGIGRNDAHENGDGREKRSPNEHLAAQDHLAPLP
jgi:hypothetical protein